MAKINIKGPIISSAQQWIYDWFGIEATSPAKVNKILDSIKTNEDLEVEINSCGGDISAGSEIYTAIRAYNKGSKKANIVGSAYSAGSVIAMACECYMSPTAMMMIHKVSCGASGNSDDMNKMSQILQVADQTIANAYIAKSGMSMKDVLKMMKEETWLTAQQAKEKGLIDGIMFENKVQQTQMYNSFSGMIPQEVIEKMQNERLNSLSKDKLKNKFKYLKLKGGI
ncbi:Clp protease ClpP [Clostridium botulinum]|uniref:head maturation protease, ClpP-related n=1 Tax=Clostridium sporogenes TaxID=1509 RepID=UPI0013D27973|nr:head maturation protease, ClpP-related [Clostridium sporogenes]EKO1913614.1 Clp protease ClpP [Clostridium botulinum]EKO2043670.1 Clp protease ClpP [Clostridium botulinum]NFQ85122.1 Clp protease ClpP [Clostridium sporogenes]